MYILCVGYELCIQSKTSEKIKVDKGICATWSLELFFLTYNSVALRLLKRRNQIVKITVIYTHDLLLSVFTEFLTHQILTSIIWGDFMIEQGLHLSIQTSTMSSFVYTSSYL